MSVRPSVTGKNNPVLWYESSTVKRRVVQRAREARAAVRSAASTSGARSGEEWLVVRAYLSLRGEEGS